MIGDKLKIKDSNGITKEYEIIANVHVNGKNIVAYTLPEQKGELSDILINSLEIENDEVILGKVTDEEYEKVLAELKERVK